jgi:hypothetical protein
VRWSSARDFDVAAPYRIPPLKFWCLLPHALPAPDLAIPMIDLSCGALGGIRTPDPQIRSLVLYPAELRAPRAFCIEQAIQIPPELRGHKRLAAISVKHAQDPPLLSAT